jgi:hypothetical protein
MKNLKTIMIAALLMLAAVGELVAQEKWEYAAVAYSYGKIVISIAGKEVKSVEVQKEEMMPDKKNMNPVLKQLQELSDAGWNWFNSSESMDNTGFFHYHFYLKREKSNSK